MIKVIKARMNKQEDEGFTLIELLVVVLIIGILMAIAIPTFLSLTGGAKTNAAESDLTTASQDEAVYYTQNGSYDVSASPSTVAGNLADMQAVDPGLNWTLTAPAASGATGPGTKSVSLSFPTSYTATVGGTAAAPTVGQDVMMGTAGQNGSYYWVNSYQGTLTYYKTSAATAPTPALTASNTSWKSVG